MSNKCNYILLDINILFPYDVPFSFFFFPLLFEVNNTVIQYSFTPDTGDSFHKSQTDTSLLKNLNMSMMSGRYGDRDTLTKPAVKEN